MGGVRSMRGYWESGHLDVHGVGGWDWWLKLDVRGEESTRPPTSGRAKKERRNAVVRFTRQLVWNAQRSVWLAGGCTLLYERMATIVSVQESGLRRSVWFSSIRR